MNWNSVRRILFVRYLVILAWPGAAMAQSGGSAQAYRMTEAAVLNNNYIEQYLQPSVALRYSTYFGGTDLDYGYAITVDGNGCMYMAGLSDASWWGDVDGTHVARNDDLPTTPGVFQRRAPGMYDEDGFVAKFSPEGQLIYSTYLGAYGYDEHCTAIAVDSSGCAYVTGYTYSPNFPVTPNAFMRFPSRYIVTVPDAFVAKLASDGSSLLYSSYLGGEDEDVGYGIAVDEYGCAYVAGLTGSVQFPVSLDAFQRTDGSVSAFVSRVSADGASLVYSTCLGGSEVDIANAIAVDGSGRAYVAGYTSSADFPTLNPYQTCRHAGGFPGFDAFISVLAPGGDSLDYSTCLGGSGNDMAQAIAIAKNDGSGGRDDLGHCIYVAGTTNSTDFPTLNAIQPSCKSAPCPPGANGVQYYHSFDAFVTKLSAVGNSLVYSTYLGGAKYDEAEALALDSQGCAHVAGRTRSADYPLKRPFQDSVRSPSADLFVTKLSPEGTALAYSTYLGGCNAEDVGGCGIAMGRYGACVVGATDSIDFPTTSDAEQRRLSAPTRPFLPTSIDAFLAVLADLPPELPPYRGELFANPLCLYSNIPVQGNNARYSNDFTSYCCFPYSETGADVVYRFDTTSTMPIRVSLTGLSADLDILLCDSSCVCVAYSARGSTSDESIAYTPSRAGAWYVVVDGFSGSKSPYRLAVSTTP